MARFINRPIDPATEFLVRQFEDGRLYGELVLKYDCGKMVLARKTETIKPYSDSNKESDGDLEMANGANKQGRS